MTEIAINRVKTGTESMYQRWRGTPYWKASLRYSSEKTDDLELSDVLSKGAEESVSAERSPRLMAPVL